MLAIRTFILSVLPQLLDRRILPLWWIMNQGIVLVVDLLFELFVVLNVFFGNGKQGFDLVINSGLIPQLFIY